MGFLTALIFILFALCGVFLILIVLIQRGKGGGLAGAFGGMGGHSAFGTRAGDKLMRITIGVAATWIILAMVAVRLTARAPSETRFSGRAGAAGEQPRASESDESDSALPPGAGGGQREGPALEPAQGDATEGAAEPTEPATTPSEAVAPAEPDAAPADAPSQSPDE